MEVEAWRMQKRLAGRNQTTYKADPALYWYIPDVNE